uniref:Uncharacterized protein n=1 Tax=Biomphalaria glabrata TaxID=6526 RepID=A0A2C9KLU2_BIOGL
MSAERPVLGVNDSLLFSAIASKSNEDIHQIFMLTEYKLTSFSNHALNWSVLQACRLGHELLIQYLLQDGARLEVRDDNGNTPLLICSTKNIPGAINFLLKQGADVNAANNNGDTAIILAESKEVIKILLSHNGINLDRQDKNGDTALMAAIQSFNLVKSSLLITSGACPKTVVNTSGENALQVANRLGIGPILELLYHSFVLERHPLINQSINGDYESCNALLGYSLYEDTEIINIRPNILCVVLNCIKGQQNNRVTPDLLEFVRRLCRSGVSVNQCSDCGKSPLDIAVDIKNHDLAEILCENGADMSHNTVVNLVVKNATHLIPLFAVHGAYINQIHPNGYIQYPGSALDVALKQAKIGSAMVLLYHGAELDESLALEQAVETCNCRTLEFLLEGCKEKVEAHLQNEPDLFFKAVRTGDIRVLSLLLEAGADVNMVHKNKTPLMNAVHLDVMRYLLKNGADVNMKSNTTSIINVCSEKYIFDINFWAFQEQPTEDQVVDTLKQIIRLFLKHGAHLDAADDKGNTALIASVNKSCPKDVMIFLLKEGSNINQRNSKGESALYTAVIFNDQEKLTILLSHGANINLQNKEGLSPLHESIHNIETLKILLKHKANVNLEDSKGNTALLHAVKNVKTCLQVCVDSLTEAGSDVNHTNHDGMTALMLAADNHNFEMSSLLKANADVNNINTKQQHPKTALSILLNKWYPDWGSQHLASELLKHGANAKLVLPEVLHRIIAMGNVQLVQQLIASGLGPTDIILRRNLMEWPVKTISPLSVCLMTDQLQLAKYLIENWYLTQSDLAILSRDKTILDHLDFRINEFLKEHSSQPPRLEFLSFVRVSASVGSGPDREDKIKHLCLPHILQEYLLFKKVAAEESLDEDGNEDDSSLFCYELTKKQVGAKQFRSEFLSKDIQFLEFHNTYGGESSSDDSDSDGDWNVGVALEEESRLINRDNASGALPTDNESSVPPAGNAVTALSTDTFSSDEEDDYLNEDESSNEIKELT